MPNRRSLPPYPDDVSLRELASSDRVSLFHFRCADDNEYSKRVEERIRKEVFKLWRKKNQRVRVWIAEQEHPKKIVGLIAYESFYGDESYGSIHLLAVTHDRRREGIATALKQAALNQTAIDGCVGAESSVAFDNFAMQRVNDYWNPVTEPSEDDDGFLKTVIRYEEET